MKTYVCDICGHAIKNPFESKMVEFMYSAEIDENGIFPKWWKKKNKMHFCNKCFANMRDLLLRLAKENKERGMIFSKSEVELMSDADIKANYADILRSMRHWD